jgi:tetratricopeptide (TPR) repeat protein
MAEQDFSEIAKLSERFSKDPKSRIFVQLADAYRKNNMVDEALEVMKQGLQYHPQYPLAHLIMGRCFFDKRLYTQAKESFEKVIRIDPQNIVALRMLAQVCENLKDEAGQIAAYKGLLAVDPLDTMAKDRLIALEAIQKKQSFYTITMAQEYERQGNLTEALKVYENLSFSDPTDLGIQEKVRELKQKLSTGTPAAPSAEPKKDEKARVWNNLKAISNPMKSILTHRLKPRPRKTQLFRKCRK